jgi:polysaccharide biosynthesis protein PslH
MRILFLSTIVPYPPHGGIYQRTYNILKRLAAVHDVIFVGFEKTADDRQNVEHIRKLCSEVYTYRLPDDWSKSALYYGLIKNIFNTLPYTSQKYHLTAVADLIRKKSLDGEIDAVHIDITDLATYGDYTFSLPKIITHHNINSQLWASQAKAEKNPLKKLYMWMQVIKFKKFERLYSPKYDINITVSPMEEKVLAKLIPPEKIRVVPNGVDVDYFRPTDPALEQENEVIFAGSPNYYPNAVAIEWWCEKIVPALYECGLSDVYLTVLGGREKAQKNVICYLENPQEYNLRVPGFVDDIRPYVARSSVYVVPLQSGGGTRLKVLDALAMGKAVLSTSIGCEGLAVTQGENILIADSPEKFTASLKSLLKQKDKRHILGQNGRKLVAGHYSWDKICDEMMPFYSKIK